MKKNVLLWKICIFILAIFICSLPSQAFQVQDSDVWYDDLTGTAMTKHPRWTDENVNTLFSRTPSYMFVSMTAQTNATGSIKSFNISADFDFNDTLEMKIVENEPRVNFQWKVQLRGMNGSNPLNLHALHDLSGANGVFSFPIQKLTNWRGEKEFRIEINFENSNTVAAHHYTLFDYFRVYQNTTEQIYFWQDDFDHKMEIGLEVNNWWDNEAFAYNENQHAVIRYAAEGARVHLTDNTSGLVRSPGVYWDTQKYYIFEMNIVDIQPGVSGKIILLQIDDYEVNQKIGTFTRPGRINIDLRTFPDLPWQSAHMLTVELHITGSPGQYYTLDYIGFLADKHPKPLPTATPPVFPKGCYAVPNPFIPSQAPVQFFTRFTNIQETYQIKIINLTGRVVRTLTTLSWDGKDEQGNLCEGGIYIYQITSGEKRVSGKVVLIH
ncbi:T9SS type A sorting domain-containing protein [bacterium]|nr:T9SS type A sorting domain-containing protein [bacterium]